MGLHNICYYICFEYFSILFENDEPVLSQETLTKLSQDTFTNSLLSPIVSLTVKHEGFGKSYRPSACCPLINNGILIPVND
jgi:hypothetical protein